VFVTLVAAVTMSIYVGFMNYFLLLVILAFFSRVAMYVVLALLGTLLLPCKPVLWPAFNRLWIFRTWRHYFHYRWGREAGRLGGKGATAKRAAAGGRRRASRSVSLAWLDGTECDVQ
jgi:hypothetical protein